MTRRLIPLVLAAALACAATASAEERFALIVTGAPGGESFASTYAEWQQQLQAALIENLGFMPANVTVLSGTSADAAEPGADTSTGQNVRAAITALRARLQKDDLLLIVLVGHGTLDGGEAKFNLVGPDLTSVEWGELLHGLPGRVVAINTTGGSFPFMRDLAARGRIVLTATQSVAQRYDTVFPEQFIAALRDPAADLDKNGRVSMWELFQRTSHAVANHYERQGLLPTERAMLDDTGDGEGIEAGGKGDDGALARATYLERDPVAAESDPEMIDLLTRRRALEEQAERLKQRKPTMPLEQWEREFEELMIELARVSRRMRSRS